MPRVSRREAEKHREDILAAASKLFREFGIDGVSVPVVMAEAGLTHGGFYGHFASKEALAAEACSKAFSENRGEYAGVNARYETNKDAARIAFIRRYVSKTHRDGSKSGCAAAGFASCVARDKPKGAVRAAYVSGLETMVKQVSTLLSGRRRKPIGRDQTLATVAMLVGSVILARATGGYDISDEILAAVRNTQN